MNICVSIQFSVANGDVSSRLWDIECGACIRVLEGHEELVRCIRYPFVVYSWLTESTVLNVHFYFHVRFEAHRKWGLLWQNQSLGFASCPRPKGSRWHALSPNSSCTFGEILLFFKRIIQNLQMHKRVFIFIFFRSTLVGCFDFSLTSFKL